MKLFVAIDLDERARDFIADVIASLRSAGLDARFQPRDKWHITLAFLGETGADRYAAVLTTLRTVVAPLERFDLQLDRIGAFPDLRRPRILWAGSSSPQPSYLACAQAIRTALAPLGFRFEDDAVPHVTLCRLKKRHGSLPEVRLGSRVIIAVDALNLYESIVDGATTRYAIRERYPLKEIAS